MSGPPPPGYYPPPPTGQNPAPFPGQYPAAASPAYYNPPQGQQQTSPYVHYPAPGQLYPQGAVPPPYVPPTGGYYPPPYAGQPSPAQAAYPPVVPAALPGQGPHPGYGIWGPQPAVPPAAHPGMHPGGYHGHPHVDVESDDSDPHESALYSREDKHPLTVKFTNKTGKKVQLFWINKKGRRKRRGKLKDGQSKSIDTFESHIFMAINKKVSREPLLINGSSLFYVFPGQHGSKHVTVDITKPSAHSAVDKLKSDAQVSIPVEVKFVNRSRREVQLDWVTTQGRREKKKVLPRGRCWRTTSWEGHYWVCCDPKQSDRMFVLNFGRYYRVQKSRRPRERVVITAGW